MATIQTYLRTYAEHRGVVWVQFYIRRQKVHFTTKVCVKKSDWSTTKLRVKASDPAHADKNLIISNILARLNNVFVKYRLRDKVLTKDAFMRAYNRPNDYDTIFPFIEDYQKRTSARMEDSTFYTHRSVVDKIKLYAPALHFDDITTEWLDKYYSYLRKNLKNNDNTAGKNMSILRKYVRAAWKAGYMDTNPFEEWHIQRTKASYNYLTEEELHRLIELYHDGTLEHRQHITLQFFLFMCFSSLHVTDAKNLKLEQFMTSSFTYFRIKLRNKKPEPIVVPISTPLKTLLHNIVGTRKKGRIFENLPADQTMNRTLKDIAEIAEIDKPITHKTGRHTFATIFLKKTKDIASLKDILGHSELRETLVYAHVMDETKQEGIKIFDTFDI